MTAPLCFVDTETDGLHPGRKAWEVALIRRDEAGENAEHLFLTIDLSTSDPAGLRVGGFYDRHPLGRRLSGRTGAKPPARVTPMPTAAAAIARATHGAHIVGAVPNFDTEVLERLLRDQGFAPAWNHRLIDVRTLAIGWLAGRGQAIDPSVGTTEVTAALGIDPVPATERHTALGDARWAMRVYDAVLSRQTAGAAA